MEFDEYLVVENYQSSRAIKTRSSNFEKYKYQFSKFGTKLQEH